jgi:hypothetical protein
MKYVFIFSIHFVEALISPNTFLSVLSINGLLAHRFKLAFRKPSTECVNNNNNNNDDDKPQIS